MSLTSYKIGFLLLFILIISWSISAYFYLARYYRENQILAGIFYYARYGEKRHWNDFESNIVVDQPYTKYYQGYYSSLNETLIYYQLKLVEKAGIDFLLVSWFPPESYEDRVTRLLFEVVREHNLNIKVALMVEPVDDYDTNMTKLEQIKIYVMENYVKPYNQYYFYWKDKPLLAFFVPLNPPRDSEYSFRVVGEQPYADWPYWSVPPKITGEGVISVLPRYDDSHLPRERKIIIDETYGERLYDEQWRFVLNNKDGIKLVLIATWNEYHERTMIEPHLDATADPEFYFPDYLYQKTCEYIKLLKEKPFPITHFYPLPPIILLMFILYKSFQMIRRNISNLRRFIQQIISIGVVSRLLIIFVASLSNTMLGLRKPFEGENLPDYEIPILNLFARWDSGYYIIIARSGYTALGQWAFRPLFPLILNSINFLFTSQESPTPINLIIIGFFVNNILFIISLLLFHKLSLKFSSEEEALIFTLMFTIYPPSFIFSAIYPEALFITLLLIGYNYLEERKILLSSLFTFISGLCRPEGFTTFLIYLIKGICDKQGSGDKVKYIVASFISFSSLPIFLFYSFLKTGSLFTPFEAEALWARTGIIEMILRIKNLQLNVNPGLSLPYLILNLPLFLMIITTFAYYYIFIGLFFSDNIYRKIFPYVFHAILYVIFISFFVDYISVARLSLFVFPVIWIIGHESFKNKMLLYAILIINVMLLTFYTLLHVNWYHVT